MRRRTPSKKEMTKWGLPAMRGGQWTWLGNGWQALGRSNGGEPASLFGPCGVDWTVFIPEYLNNFSAYSYWIGPEWFAEDPVNNPNFKGRAYTFTQRGAQYGLPSNVPVGDHGLEPLKEPYIRPDQHPANYTAPTISVSPVAQVRPPPSDIGFIVEPGGDPLPFPPHGKPPEDKGAQVSRYAGKRLGWCCVGRRSNDRGP